MNTPILLIIFNRPQKIESLIDSLRIIKPTKIFIAADGPRKNKDGERELCSKTRDMISLIDWPCEIHKNFQETNLGCKYGPITAIDWFFENVDSGIILEDDCIPNFDFYNYCRELLAKYEDTPQVMHISGNNFQDDKLRGDTNSSYYFSKYTHSWGWATWRRAWSLFHKAVADFDSFNKENKISKVPIGRPAQKYWIKNFIQTINGTDSWDSLWLYTVWYNSALAILPQKNLVNNIGFGNDATHTKTKSIKTNTSTHNLSKIIHADKIFKDEIADKYTFQKLFRVSITSKILSRVKKVL